MQIGISPRELSDAAERIAVMAAELTSQRNRIENLVHVMEGQWLGPAGQCMGEQLLELSHREKKSEAFFLDFSQVLKEIAEEWADADYRWEEKISSV